MSEMIRLLQQKGTKAPQAAGKIHTDFEKGFIMAEVMKFSDFKEEGSESAVKVCFHADTLVAALRSAFKHFFFFYSLHRLLANTGNRAGTMW